MHQYCLFNGEIKDTSQPVFQVNDLAILRGYGIFDFMPVRQSRPLFYDDYWSRFSNSARISNLDVSFTKEEFEEQIRTLVTKNKFTDGFCRVILTGGYSSNGFAPDNNPNCVVTTLSSFEYDPTAYTEGIKLLTLEFVRENPLVKSLNYSTVLMKREQLKKEGAEDVLYLDKHQKVSESSRANLFIYSAGGILMTPQSDILPGITRKKLLEVAQETGIPAKIEDFNLEEVKNARAAFLTSTTKNIMPVSRIDDFQINGGIIDPVINKLQKALKEKIDRYIAGR